MNEQTPAKKKSQLAGNLVGAGLIVGFAGMFLGWRASNMETTSGAAALLICLAGVLLIAALVSHLLRKH